MYYTNNKKQKKVITIITYIYYNYYHANKKIFNTISFIIEKKISVWKYYKSYLYKYTCTDNIEKKCEIWMTLGNHIIFHSYHFFCLISIIVQINKGPGLWSINHYHRHHSLMDDDYPYNVTKKKKIRFCFAFQPYGRH